MKCLTTNDVAKLAGMKYHTFYSYVRSGDIPRPAVVGGRMLWAEEEAERACRILSLLAKKNSKAVVA